MANLTEKIIAAHITDGDMVAGTEIGIRIDQTLTQDATGTMAYIEFEMSNNNEILYYSTFAGDGKIFIYLRVRYSEDNFIR